MRPEVLKLDLTEQTGEFSLIFNNLLTNPTTSLTDMLIISCLNIFLRSPALLADGSVKFEEEVESQDAEHETNNVPTEEKMQYGIGDYPPWYITILYGFQVRLILVQDHKI